MGFLVVVDMFMTQTGRMADVGLPASSCFEKTQINRAYLRNRLVCIQNQVIKPLAGPIKSYDQEVVYIRGSPGDGTI